MPKTAPLTDKQRKQMRWHKETVAGQEIDLTGKHVTECVFIECRLIIRTRTPPTFFQHNSCHKCDLHSGEPGIWDEIVEKSQAVGRGLVRLDGSPMSRSSSSPPLRPNRRPLRGVGAIPARNTIDDV